MTEIEDRIRTMYATGLYWQRDIAAILHISEYKVSKVVSPNFQTSQELRLQYKRNKRKKRDFPDWAIKPIEFTPEYCPKRDGYRAHRSESSAWLGDPPVGQSALEQR